MPKYRRKRNTNPRIYAVLFALLALALLIYAIASPPAPPLATAPAVSSDAPSVSAPASEPLAQGVLSAVFIDVGQGDSSLVIAPSGQTMLIDAGERGNANRILAVLEAYDVQRLDHVVATHPHSDHIGSMLEVLKAVEWGTLYMPNATHTSATFLNLLEYVDAQGRTIDILSAGDTIDFTGTTVEVLAPGDGEQHDLNNASLVLRITHGDTAFLYTGDCEKQSENAMLNAGAPLQSRVLKVPHHGSNTSSTSAFLDAVSPEYAILSLGRDNDYGHPHAEVMARLQATGTVILRTDESGNIALYSDGESLRVEVER